jgi:hypothetical protein
MNEAYDPTLRSGADGRADPPDIFRAVSERMDLFAKAALACTLNALTEVAKNTEKRILFNMFTSIVLIGV